MRLGLCTGGGDCPGLNAVIRAIVKHGIRTYGMEIVGIYDSFNGLMENPPRVKAPLVYDDVSEILCRGGTILGTYNRGDNFKGARAAQDVAATLAGVAKLGLDGMIVIGGEGTQGIARQLLDAGLRVIGIPKTIDNDLPGTDQTVGFSTCVDLVSDAVMRLQSTAESHDRIMVLEVMGRDSGYIALHGGIAGGAHAILVPELPYDLKAIISKIQERKQLGRNYSVVVVSEGSYPAGKKPLYLSSSGGTGNLGGIGQILAKELADATGMESRFTVLGHLQRGGAPNAHDKILATRLGVYALDLAAQKRFGNIVVWQGSGPNHIPYTQIVPKARRVLAADDPLIVAAEGIGICMGRHRDAKGATG